METASDVAPAVDATLTTGADEKNLPIEQRRLRVAELYPLGHTDDELAAVFGVSRRAIQRDRAAMNVPGRRTGPRVNELEQQRIKSRRRRVRAAYDAGEKSSAIATAEGVSLYTLWCDLKATGPRRPAGQQILYPEHAGPRTCDYCGREFEAKPSRVARGFGETCSNVCKMKRRYRDGRGVAREMTANLPGWARQRLLGRWSGSKPPSVGARPRGRPKVIANEAQAAEIQRLAASGWGRRAIASRLCLSERLVRNVLDS
jgi:DNA invertase Pin-like site-specific DNA recombinase